MGEIDPGEFSRPVDLSGFLGGQHEFRLVQLFVARGAKPVIDRKQLIGQPGGWGVFVRFHPQVPFPPDRRPAVGEGSVIRDIGVDPEPDLLLIRLGNFLAGVLFGEIVPQT